MSKSGYIHSFESLGAVDGPNLRFVIFMQGCLLRCLYCHNPDSWNLSNARYKMTADEVAKKVLSYKSFIKNGGVTISGGEPLMQAEFVAELIDKLHKYSISCAIDTSGAIELDKSKEAIQASDLIILDIKDIDVAGSIELTGQDNKNTIKTLIFTEAINKPVWIRQVILEGYTLNEQKLKRLGEFLSRFENIERIELIPYHTMGVHKWEELGLDYSLNGVKPTNDEQIEKASKILKQFDKIKEKIR
ncbi:MAG: pyruvate formate lyase-activating protein [Ruminococcus sp.]|nr:pyruvate formate lyase-activating protein [Ruminococcus sp.]